MLTARSRGAALLALGAALLVASPAAHAQDTTTDPPWIYAPSDGDAFDMTGFLLGYILSEPPLSGSVTATLDDGAGGAYVLLLADPPAGGEGEAWIEPGDPTGDPGVLEISGGSSIPPGTYVLTLSYQDALGNPPASHAITGITLDAATQPPTIGGVTDGETVGDAFTLLLGIPEESGGPLDVYLERVAGTPDDDHWLRVTTCSPAPCERFLPLIGSDLCFTDGVDAMLGSCSLAHEATYLLTLSYSDFVGNAPASDTLTITYAGGPDRCAEGLDYLDADGDGVPDACDGCPGGNDAFDSDGDGFADDCDLCPGGDDGNDTDGDSVPNACDVCPDRAVHDADGDTWSCPLDCDDDDAEVSPEASERCDNGVDDDCDGDVDLADRDCGGDSGASGGGSGCRVAPDGRFAAVLVLIAALALGRRRRSSTRSPTGDVY